MRDFFATAEWPSFVRSDITAMEKAGMEKQSEAQEIAAAQTYAQALIKLAESSEKTTKLLREVLRLIERQGVRNTRNLG